MLYINIKSKAYSFKHRRYKHIYKYIMQSYKFITIAFVYYFETLPSQPYNVGTRLE